MARARIASVDMLRGLTIAAMILVNNPGTWGSVYAPLLHAEWHGLTPTDLIFPFFLFIVGISIALAYKDANPSSKTYKKIVIRSLKLIGLGLFLNWFLPYVPFFKDFENLRLPGVLQRIGVVFLVSAILFLNVGWKTLLGIGATILIGYWLFMGFVPLPDGTLPTFNRAPNNWANYIDLQLFGNHMWKADYDPEGLLSTLPAIATCITGIHIGRILSSSKASKQLLIASLGAFMLAIGYLWSIWFPLNKAIWSSSFVLVTSGWGCIILALVYYITDIQQITVGRVFTYMGMNAITVFFLSGFIAKSFYLTKVGDHNIHSWLYTNLFVWPALSDKFSSLLYALCVVGFFMALAYYLYKKNIFIKV